MLFCRRLIAALFRRRWYLLLLLVLVVVVVAILLLASVGMCHLLIGRLLSRLLLLLPPRTLGKPDTQRYTHIHTHTSLTALFPGLPRWAGTRKVKPIWILLKKETVSGSGISWDICNSAPHSRQITTPAPHRSVFYRPDALPAAQPTASKH